MNWHSYAKVICKNIFFHNKKFQSMRAVQKISLGSVMVILIAFAACQKNNLSVPDDAAMLATSNARIDNESNKVEDVVNSVALSAGIDLTSQKLEGGGFISLLPACATVAVDTLTMPHSIVIDFGTTPCLCDQWDNRYRKVSLQSPGPAITNNREL